MKTLSAYLSEVASFASELDKAVLDIVKPELYKKVFLSKPGRVCRYIWYLEKGLIRIYENRGYKEITHWLLDAPAMIIAPDSSLDGITPSRMFIQPLEPCHTQRAAMADVHKVIREYPQFDEHYKIINARYRDIQNEREADLRALDPEERMRKLFIESPSFFHRVKNAILCQYLNVSPGKFAEYKKVLLTIRK